MLESRRYFAAISFANHVDFAAGTSPITMVTADFNRDGNLDLAAADSFSRVVNIFFGNGTGIFNASATPLALTAPPVSMVVGDFNADAAPDIAVGTSPGSSNPGTGVTVFISKADATGAFNTGLLTTVRTGVGTNEPLALAVGDFNSDGKLDVVTANFSLDSASILLGAGNGTFQAPTTLATGAQPTAIVAADFNGDTKLDLAVADERTDRNTNAPVNVVSIFFGSGAGGFTPSNDVVLSSTGSSNLAVGDIDRDGTNDLIVGNTDGSIAVFVNLGNGTFANSATIPLASLSAASAVADFNFDGATDLLSVNGSTPFGPGPNSVSVITGQGSAQFLQQTDFATGTSPAAEAVGDFNGDGKPDIATANAGGGTISILLNESAGVASKSTTTTLTSNLASAKFGSNVLMTASVSASSATPSGAVRFFDGVRPIGTVALTGGVAVLSTAALDVGPHAIRAIFLGAGLFAASHSGPIAQTITPVPGHGPDLSGSFVLSTVPTALVPGERVIVRVLVTNVGNIIASGSIVNSLFLSSDGAIDGGDTPVPVLGPLATARINLLPNRSIALAGLFTVPAGAPLGDFSLLTQINSTGSLLEADPGTNDVAVSPTLSVLNGFGNVGGRANIFFTGKDADGTPITYRLIGPGSGSVTDGVNGADISVAGTTAASALLVITGRGGNGIANLHSLTSSGRLSLVGPAVDFTGTVALDGGTRQVLVRSLTGATMNIGAGGVASALSLGNLDNATLTSATGIQSMLVTKWTTGGGIAAPWIGALLSRGEFASNLSLSGAGSPAGTALRAASIAGALGGSAVWSINGNVTSLLLGGFAGTTFSAGVNGKVQTLVSSGGFTGDFAAAGGFGAIAVRGAVTNAHILAGADLGADGRIGGGDDTFAAASLRLLQVLGSINGSTIGAGLDPVDGIFGNGNDALIAGGSINTVAITGTFNSDSRILASGLPARARVGAALVTTAGDPRFTLNS